MKKPIFLFLIFCFSIINLNAQPVCFNPVSSTEVYNTRTIIGDFNNDGFADIIGFYIGHYLMVGTGTGSFVNMPNFSNASGYFFFEKGDFNQDGNLDLAAFNYFIGRIRIFTGNGLGAFSIDSVAVPNADAFKVGDVNSDGKSDLVVTFSNVAEPSFFFGTSSGTFQAVSAPNAMSTFSVVGIADFNGDGLNDLMGQKGPTFAIFKGNNTAAFTNSVALSSFSLAYLDYFVDVNNDGKADILNISNGINVRKALSNFQFANAVNYNFPNASVTSVSFGDINSDGYIDVFGIAPNTFYYSLNNGAAGFQAVQNFTYSPLLPNNYVIGLYLADVDGNNKADLFMANSSSTPWGKTNILLNCNLVGLSEESSLTVTLYPQPVSQFLYIQGLDLHSDLINFSVYDLQGKMFQSLLPEAIDNKLVLDFTDFENGYYSLIGKNRTGQIIATKKVIVQH